MEWKELGVVLFGLLNFAWTAYVFSRQQQKEDKQLHLSQSSEWYADIIEEQKEMKIAEKELRSSVQHYALQVAELTYKIQGESKEKEYFKSKIERLAKSSRQREKKIEELQERENELESEIARINQNQLERIENESKVLIENQQLKAEIKEIREHIRTLVKSYEDRLLESDRQNRALNQTIKKQGKAIETMKLILEQNNLVANVDI